MAKPFTRGKEVSPYIKNEQIRVPEVRVLDSAGQMLGVMSTTEALKKAQELEIDLIMISPTAQPPVVKIIDYGQFLYQKKKEEQKMKSKQTKAELKILKVSLNTSEHDAGRQIEKALKMIEEGDKVRFEMRLKGREKSKKEFASNIMRKMLQNIGESAKVEQPVTVQESTVTFTITSKK